MKKSHESAEDYLETILILRERKGNVRSIDIVNEMNYSKPSISIAMKKLKSEGMVEMDLNGYITLTPLGEEIAQRTYRRHQLLEKVLVAMGVDEETAAEEACRIEHVIDENTYEKINEFYEKHMSGANQ
ncbi:MAG: metal-dependent transcriptional regulator [Lachnospiraceae bacterium]|jgi:Mn-dependent DtxR family transcriptional regulator|nr:metal-dependent transcriptional regulator [Lachnospiraceae bacterium]